jgi:tripartite-type tricarboxylate transporter receptor subunit TctC
MRRLIAVAACVAVLPAVLGVLAGAAPARGETWPARPVRVVVSFPPGGGTDIVGRILGQKLSERLGQQFVVENRAGASGNIGIATVAKATPDGYTLLVTSSVLVVNPTLYPKAGWTMDELAPITCVGGAPNALLVTPTLPQQNVRALIAWLEAEPGKHGFATPGNGTTPHLAGELFRMAYGIDMVSVPFSGAAPALQSLMQGQTPLAFMMLSNATELIRGGSVRALAVTSAHRNAAVPDVPTMAEAGVPDQVSDTLQFVMAPAGTPPAIVNRLQGEIVRIVAQPETRAQFAGLGFEIMAGTPDETSALITTEVARWAKVVRDADIKVN